MPGAETSADPLDQVFPLPFGNYLLLTPFARGGMGEVFLAKHGSDIEGAERFCVLKKLRRDLTSDREYVARFVDEARIVVTLNHANICHTFDVGRVVDEFYLAMEYVSGVNLKVLLRRTGEGTPPPPEISLFLICEALEALDYAHRRRHPMTGEPLCLVHRDVSPQNIMLSFEGEVKLIDFGLASSRLKLERTQPHIVMGKLAYMSPEQARGLEVDGRADQFAAAIALYELLSGTRFYTGLTPQEMWEAVGMGNHQPAKWMALDAALREILAPALAPHPEDRYPDCGALRERLLEHLHRTYPGTNVATVRRLITRLLHDDMEEERERLARFGRVAMHRFSAQLERT